MFLLQYWPTYSDAGADNLWSLFHSSAKPFFNLSYWNSPAYDKLVDTGAAITGTSASKAQALYSKAMQMLYDQAPGVYLYDLKSVLLVPNDLQGEKLVERQLPVRHLLLSDQAQGLGTP